MHEQLWEAFDSVRAEDALKNRTKAYIAEQTRGYTRARPAGYRNLVTAAACLLLMLAGGHWLYFTPTAEISIDINPSIELGINRFDKVVSVDGYNDDGQALAETLDLKFTDYEEAVNQILANETVANALSGDAVMTIAVIGGEDAQTSRIFANLEECTEGQQNTYCYCAHTEEVETAHDLGLSYGKYQAYLEVKALDPGITPEEIQNMTMREIWDLIDALSAEEDAQTGTTTDGSGWQGHHGGNGYGHGRGGHHDE